MARAYTTTGIAITFNTGAESGNLRVLDEEGNPVVPATAGDETPATPSGAAEEGTTEGDGAE